MIWTTFLGHFASAIAEKAFAAMDSRRKRLNLHRLNSTSLNEIIGESSNWNALGEEWKQSVLQHHSLSTYAGSSKSVPAAVAGPNPFFNSPQKLQPLTFQKTTCGSVPIASLITKTSNLCSLPGIELPGVPAASIMAFGHLMYSSTSTISRSKPTQTGPQWKKRRLAYDG